MEQFFNQAKLYINITQVTQKIRRENYDDTYFKKVQTEVYAQGNAGVLRNPAGENFSNIGAALGGEINYKGTYLKAEAGIGTAVTGKVELGHEFDIGKNLGFEIFRKHRQ